ncbi:MAG TPA: DUF5004 domain-containing protein [Paludibacteraceae bacterium]|nr:DUF5004 domain-containing protein [Paludibacteraceae bacterium]HOK99933.1 DUF5004 domain-containing protein [Paludibacteraceae bacterium]HPO66732.1 DUF5004 domain-containing protein [Paludibacteraceae bacterium]HRU63454.1 DUF5004 domain-containing protein [Paludibacteraceae bacterium]
MKSKILKTVTLLSFFTFLISCDAFTDSEFNDYKESVKDLSGVWQLKTVSRNGIDISSTMNFSQFHLNLNPNGSYTLENYLPFAVKDNGEWRVDDPQYPYNLILRENNSSEDITIGLKYPIVNGKRIISITLSPGCQSNTYVYVFEKIDNN